MGDYVLNSTFKIGGMRLEKSITTLCGAVVRNVSKPKPCLANDMALSTLPSTV